MRKQKPPSVLAWVLSATGCAVLLTLGIVLIAPPAPVPPNVAESVEFAKIDAEIAQAQAAGITQGWIQDDLAVAAFKATLKTPLFAATPAGAADGPLPKFAFLWDAYKKLYNAKFPVKNQGQVGSCVSFGSSRGYEYSLVNEIAAGKPFVFGHLVEEVVYGGSRVEIGGGRIRGDGSVGAWAAQFFQKYGGLPRGTYVNGKYKLEAYSESRCRQYGSTGVPDDLEADVKKFPAGSAAAVKTKADLMRAIANGYGVAECSNFLISFQRDANGIVGYGGAGGHCMCINGYYTDTDGAVYFHIENSWGPDAHKGPVGWGDPNTSGGWLHEKYVVKYMLSAGDTWAFSSVTGFPAKLDWFEARRPKLQLKGAGAEYALAP